MLDAEPVSASPVDELVPFTIHYIYDDEDTKLGGGEQPEQVRYGTPESFLVAKRDNDF